MDDRLEFLLPLEPVQGQEYVFRHHVPLKAEVAVQYWSRRDGKTQPPEHLLVFILGERPLPHQLMIGNPGLLGYYPPFLSHLHSILPPTHAILSTSNIGHSPYLKAPDIPLDLDGQLASKVELVQSLSAHLSAWALKEGVEKPRLSLIGHSVGAWLSCQVKKRLPELLDAVFLLFPTVGWISETWNGRTLWPIFRWPTRQLLPTLAPLLGPILPLTTFPPTTLTLLRSPITIRHCLDLSVSEMEVIRDPDLGWFSEQAMYESADSTETSQAVRGVYGIWSAGSLDGSVGREGRMVQDALGGPHGGRVKVLHKVPHAFCLTLEHSRVVAESLAEWLKSRPL
ncbi:hypothetical protein BD324DRAFT_651211 [Kockovaella imperatae]|uniref:Alpha/Beta hydrolase protein n=1 Tax=Kockovaella imperatae TaxID=4999 RepID=A0A1Y1UGS6_9TREE|nr:hypothetical protein BD324DRAFT_651211 [Kockovaella imperatae]ORX36727.1 hypothetical protein BD324DRAFT_651211 [Kockovaella imperatae]